MTNYQDLVSRQVQEIIEREDRADLDRRVVRQDAPLQVRLELRDGVRVRLSTPNFNRVTWGAVSGVEIPAQRPGDLDLAAVDQARRLSRRIRELTEAVAALERKIDEREMPQSTFLSLLDLGDLRQLRDIPVVIERSPAEVLVSWVEVEITGIGESWPEAVRSLEEQVAELFLDLQVPDAELGPLPLRWKRIISRFVGHSSAADD